MENLEDDIGEKLNFNKVERTVIKVGFREGASAGRENVFQKSFDEGYEEGFKNGLILGKYKGILKTNEKYRIGSKTSKSSENTDLPECVKQSKMGFCQICKNEDLLKTEVDCIRNFQNDSISRCLRELKETFEDVFLECKQLLE